MSYLLSVKKPLRNNYSLYTIALVVGLTSIPAVYAKNSNFDNPQDCDFQFQSETVITFDNNAYKIGLIRHEGAEWEYGVCELYGKSLSHWTLGLSNCVTTEDSIKSYSPMAGSDIEGVEKGQDPKTGVTGIKWDLKDGFSSGTFTITLDDPNYGEGEITVAAKAGNNFGTGTLPGPDCSVTIFSCNDMGIAIDFFGIYDGDEVAEGSQLRIGTTIETLPDPYDSVLFELIKPDGTVETYEDTNFPYYFLGEEVKNGDLVPVHWNTAGYPIGDYRIKAEISEAGGGNSLCYHEVFFKLIEGPICDVLYAVDDAGLNNTRFFSIDVANNFQITALGDKYPKHDIEGLAITSDGTMYASSGDNTPVDGQPRGHLYIVDKQDGTITPVGSIVNDQDGNNQFEGYEEVSALAFNPVEGSLWGYVTKDYRGSYALVKIDPTGPEPLGQIIYQNGPEIQGKIEEITWNLDGDILYASANKTRYKFSYDQNTETITLLDTNPQCFPAEVEGMNIIQGGLFEGELLLSFHEYGDMILRSYDPESCLLSGAVSSFPLIAPYSDVEGISWYCELND